MTDEPHMQKAREVKHEIHVAIVREPDFDAGCEAELRIIASALSEAYRSGVEAERARCALIAEGRDRNVMWTPVEIAAAIRKA
jgi:predicted hydrocarbon binding protein